MARLMFASATTLTAARLSILLSLLLAACAGAPAVPAPSAASTAPSVASPGPSASAPADGASLLASPTRAQAAAAAALAWSTALLAGQNERVIDCMPAVAVAALGGRDSAIHALTSAKTMNDKSVSIEAVDVRAPLQIASDRHQLYVVVPQDVTLKGPTGHIRTHGFLLAVSDDGASWKIMDGDVLKPDLRAKVFPDLPSDLAVARVAVARAPSLTDWRGGRPPASRALGSSGCCSPHG